MYLPSRAWFSRKWIGGGYPALHCSHVVDEASDLLLVLSPREDSYCRSPADPVRSCHVWLCRWALTSSRTDRNDLTSPNNRHWKSFPHLVLQRRCIFGQSAPWCQRRHSLTGVNCRTKVLQLAVRTSTHPHWCTHILWQTQTSDRCSSETVCDEFTAQKTLFALKCI